MIFGCAGSSPPLGLFSSCSEWGLLSSCGARASRWLLLLQSTSLACSGLSSCSSHALEHRLSSCGLSCSPACDISPVQELNLCLLLWLLLGKPDSAFKFLVLLGVGGCVWRMKNSSPFLVIIFSWHPSSWHTPHYHSTRDLKNGIFEP